MILFYGEGRLGNQVFQFQALTGLARDGESVLAVGLEHIQEVMQLQGPRLIVLSRTLLMKRLVKFALLPAVLRPLSRRLRLFNYVSESAEDGRLTLREGLCRTLTLVDGGYYQNASFWHSVFPAPNFRVGSQLRRAARAYLAAACAPGTWPCFVHVRRGDYVKQSKSAAENFALPIGYYHAAIHEMRSHFKNSHMVFVTDDPKWVGENFGDVEQKSLASFDSAMDFAIMTECRLGVFSNSTFSLAASLMMHDPMRVIGPLYWFGFRTGRWSPPGIHFEHDKLRYIPVEAGAGMHTGLPI